MRPVSWLLESETVSEAPTRSAMKPVGNHGYGMVPVKLFPFRSNPKAVRLALTKGLRRFGGIDPFKPLFELKSTKSALVGMPKAARNKSGGNTPESPLLETVKEATSLPAKTLLKSPDGMAPSGLRLRCTENWLTEASSESGRAVRSHARKLKVLS